REGTRKILGGLLVAMGALVVGGAAGGIAFHYGIGHGPTQAIIQALGVTNTWLLVAGGAVGLLLIAAVEARTAAARAVFVPVMLAAYGFTSAALEINSIPAQIATPWERGPAVKPMLSDADVGLAPKSFTNQPASPPPLVTDRTPCPSGMSVWNGPGC